MPVGKKSLKINEWRKNYSDKTVWTGMPKGIICNKNIVFNDFLLWQKMAIFSQNGYFLPLNGCKDRGAFAQSCPRGWQRLTRKISNCGTKLTNVVLKVWDNIWDCGGYTPPNTHFAEVICRGNHQKSPKIIKNTKRPQKPPAIPTNQPTVPPIWYLVTLCISYKVFKRKKC